MANHLVHDRKSQVVRIDAQPEPIAIETARTAVIVIDMQNDFGAKGGMFDRVGIDLSIIQKAIGPTARVLAAARKTGVKIVYLKMGFRPDLSDLGPADAPNWMRHILFGVGDTIHAPDGTESRILIRDTWNTDIVPELAPQANDVVIYKHRFSGFYQTDLDSILKELGGYIPHRHWVYHECLRRVDGQRRDVQRLCVCVARGLCGRADRTWFTTK